MSNKAWGFWKYIILADNIIFVLFLLLKTNIIACSDKQKVELRLRILSGGRQLLIFSLYTGLAQILFYFISLKIIKFDAVPKYILIPDTIITLLCIVVFYINGMLRIIFVSKRINIIKKVIIVSIMFIPFINILAIIYICSAAKSEYEHECYRVVSHNMRVDSQTCKTKFPIVLIHGLGFKDYKYINYWGRIPKELIRNGATIYYGNQEAWGTIEYNAQDVKDKILQIARETGCEKVNIIAHSKGGLDARYMISKLGMEDYVATLTMIAVPNQGSRIIDFIYILPKWFYGTAGKFIDKYFRLIGDKNPDF
ncbi:MAG: triacylglycerol lipase, partial [Bacillota bacterium]|nr:triacylglycerol lipase [Bacillota bacterium]